MSCGIPNNENTWRELGDYELKMVEITTINTQVADIKDLIQEMNIYEDIFGVFMSANITFKDSGGFVEKMPIVGNEMVTIELRTPGFDEYKKYEFLVYKISRNEKTGPEASSIVRLELCPLEMVANSLTRMSKNIKGVHDSLANDIFIEQFGDLGNTIMSELAMTEIKMVISMQSPIDVICWLTSTALSKQNETPSYVFYQTTSGYNFVSIESLKYKPQVFEYLFDPAINTKLDPEKQVRKIIDLKHDIAPNALTMVGAGAYGSQTIYHDPITKEIITGKNNNELKNTMAASPTVLPAKLRGLSAANQYTTYKCVNPNLFDEGDRSSSETAFDIEGRRKAYLTNMMSNRVVITVTGNTTLNVGDTVTMIAKSQGDDSKDTSISGKYIISAICHNIASKGHFSTLELITDGFGKLSKGIEP